MLSSSELETSTKSPISRVPYDVLSEIFIQCLSPHSHRIDERRPRLRLIQNAPMVLCQVCSSWRTMSLSTPSLWSRLTFFITVQETTQGPGSWAILKHDFEFLQYWRQNQGQIAPVISLYVKERNIIEQPDHLLVTDGMDFVLEYLTSVQYLNMDKFFWKRIRERIETGSQYTFQNLHTLVTLLGLSGFDQPERTFYEIQSLLSNSALSKLRRLHIDEDLIPDIDRPIPSHWTSLTHISMDDVSMSLTFWFSLIRSVPDLQWAYFKISEMWGISGHMTPSKWTLPKLTTLSIIFYNTFNTDTLPLSLLFTELHLPALKTLSLFSSSASWRDSRGIMDVSSVLHTAPNVTTLALGPRFISLDSEDYNPTTRHAPLWTFAAHLKHLYMRLPYYQKHKAKSEAQFKIFIQNAFRTENAWLDLAGDSVNGIRTISIINNGLSRSEEVIAAHFEELRQKMPDVEFQLLSESQSPSEQCANMWMEWASII